MDFVRLHLAQPLRTLLYRGEVSARTYTRVADMITIKWCIVLRVPYPVVGKSLISIAGAIVLESFAFQMLQGGV